MKIPSVKIIIHLFIIIHFLFFFADNLFAEEKSARKGAPVQNEKILEKDAPEIEEKIPVIKTRYSCTSLFALDLFVPGGGHFYQGKYYSGTAFAALKLIGALSLYYCYNGLQDKRDDYYDIKNDPDTEAGALRHARRDYERACQHLTFSVIGNIAVYLSSFIISYNTLKNTNEGSIPTFDLGYTPGRGSSAGNGKITFSFTLRV